MNLMQTLLFSVLLATVSACSNDDEKHPSGGEGGAGGTTATAGASGSGESGAAGRESEATGGTASGDFEIRTPGTHAVTCDDGSTEELSDVDHLCSFEDGEVRGELYVQATPVDCVVMMSAQPIFEVVASLKIGDRLEPLPGASYDFGGNHNNDALTFDYGGKTFRYYHSSFGFGWRRCQPMDCAQITEGESLFDGCTCERTHPVVCAVIAEDGSHEPLTTDGFAVCLGDSTCGQ